MRIVVRDIAEDLYDGHILALFVGKSFSIFSIALLHVFLGILVECKLSKIGHIKDGAIREQMDSLHSASFGLEFSHL